MLIYDLHWFILQYTRLIEVSDPLCTLKILRCGILWYRRGVGHSLKCRRRSQWNLKYKIWRIFPFTISVYFMYVYAYWFSVYLSTLTSSISSFSLFSRTLQVPKHHKNTKQVRFLWNLPRNLKYKRAWNMKFAWNLMEIWNLLPKFEISMWFY